MIINPNLNKTTDQNKFTKKQYQSYGEYSAFLGVINIIDQSFLLMVEDVTEVCKLLGHIIYRIQNTSLIPYNDITTMEV